MLQIQLPGSLVVGRFEALAPVSAGAVGLLRISLIFCTFVHLLVIPVAAVEPCARVRYVAPVLPAPLVAPLLSVDRLHDPLVELSGGLDLVPRLQGVLLAGLFRVGFPELEKSDLDERLRAAVIPLVRGGRGCITFSCFIFSTLVYSASGCGSEDAAPLLCGIP